MDFDDTYEALNTTIDDADDITFTPEAKTRALRKAWNDPYVVNTVWNTAGTFLTSSYQVAVPTGVSVVRDIGIVRGSTEFPTTIGNDLWSVVGTNIQFNEGAKYAIPTNSTLYIKASYKLDPDTDILPTVALQEYVIALGGYNTLTALGFKKVNLFLKNDTTLGELVTLRRELGQEVKEMRLRFAKDFESM